MYLYKRDIFTEGEFGPSTVTDRPLENHDNKDPVPTKGSATIEKAWSPVASSSNKKLQTIQLQLLLENLTENLLPKLLSVGCNT